MTLEHRHRVLLDAIFCVMTADGDISDIERAAIFGVLKQLDTPLSAEDVNVELENFGERMNQSSRQSVVAETIASVVKRADTLDDRVALMEALRVVAGSDGVTDANEQRIIDQFWSELKAGANRSSDDDVCESCGQTVRIWATKKKSFGFESDVCPHCNADRPVPGFQQRWSDWWSGK